LQAAFNVAGLAEFLAKLAEYEVEMNNRAANSKVLAGIPFEDIATTACVLPVREGCLNLLSHLKVRDAHYEASRYKVQSTRYTPQSMRCKLQGLKVQGTQYKVHSTR
jgi:hypothetical protein